MMRLLQNAFSISLQWLELHSISRIRRKYNHCNTEQKYKNGIYAAGIKNQENHKNLNK